jgi:hypothetical protein
MSTAGTRIRNGRVARPVRNTRAAQIHHGAEPATAATPYRLLWSTAIIAFVLSIIAFVLWGINGPGTLFDWIVALCT